MVWLLFAPADKIRYTGKACVVVTFISKTVWLCSSVKLHLLSVSSIAVCLFSVFCCMSIVTKVEITEFSSTSWNWLSSHWPTLTYTFVFLPTLKLTQNWSLFKKHNCPSHMWHAVLKLGKLQLLLLCHTWAWLHRQVQSIADFPVPANRWGHVFKNYRFERAGTATLVLDEIGWI